MMIKTICGDRVKLVIVLLIPFMGSQMSLAFR